MTAPSPRGPWRRRLVSLAALICSAAAPGVWAQPSAPPPPDRLLPEPPQAKIIWDEVEALSEPVGAQRTAPVTSRLVGREAQLTLNITMTDSQIFNPGTGRYDKVRLRSYQGTDVNPNAPFVAPVITINPGDTVRITLNNKLPISPECSTPSKDVNELNCFNFNRTNLHAHGLWVSPTGNSDNVLLTINPGVSFQYEYNVPADHPAGTFWYHPHLHGSTALQVGSGMVGALIIKGPRLPTPTRTGDIDTLLRNSDGTPITDRVLLMQQIPYACRNPDKTIKGLKNKDDKTSPWVCDPGDTGTVDNYDQLQFFSWGQSGRFTTINGEVVPLFRAQAGKLERWRLIHGGVRDTIRLQVRRAQIKPAAPAYGRLLASQHDQWITNTCTGPVVTQWEIATDGLTRGQVAPKDENDLQPAYRSDVVMIFPGPGDYCLIDAAAPPAGNINGQKESRQLLGMVRVDGTEQTAPLRSIFANSLKASASVFMPPAVRQKVISDMTNGLQLTSFIPHPNIEAQEVKSRQNVTFNIDTTTNPAKPSFQVNGKAYDPARIDRTLMLGSVEEWTLRSDFVGHPFHIHVNPFQILQILDPQGNDVSVDGEPNSDPTKADMQYANLKFNWKDTIFVKQGYKIIFRTRYERYIGDYVLHCHILDHEDQGMMQNVRVAIPDGQGGTISGHH